MHVLFFKEIDMKHNKIIAGLAVAGSLIAMSGAANAISPAAAIGLAAIGGAAVGAAAAQPHYPYVSTVPSAPATVAVVPSAPATVVMGAAPAPLASGHYEVINGVQTWVPGATISYDHDGDGVQNHVDRFPNDPGRS
jgi:hypothetical protein